MIVNLPKSVRKRIEAGDDLLESVVLYFLEKAKLPCRRSQLIREVQQHALVRESFHVSGDLVRMRVFEAIDRLRLRGQVNVGLVKNKAFVEVASC